MEDREPLNEKRVRLMREKAILEALDEIHEMNRYWRSEDKCKAHRQKAMELLLKAMR